MAYMSQEHKKSKAPAIKAILKKYGVKASLGVYHSSTLVLNIKSGKIDFIGNYNQTYNDQPQMFSMFHEPNNGYIKVNQYHYKGRFTGIAVDFIEEIIDAMMLGNHNNSDYYTDYHDVGFYIDINIGQYNKNYILE